MKYIILLALTAFSFNAWSVPVCDDVTMDSLVEKQLYVMAKRYNSEKVGVGVSILNGNNRTTSIAIFQGVGGNDGVKVDRIGSITIDLEKCAVKNTLIGIFTTLDVKGI